MLYNPDGVISQTPWEDKGFHILPVFTESEQWELHQGATRLITNLFDKLGYAYPEDFKLEQYHTIVTTTTMHQEIISQTRGLSNKEFIISVDDIARRTSKAVNRKLNAQNPFLIEAGIKNLQIVTLRICRPSSLDINPPHRDSYLNYYKPVLNCWIPIAGCNEHSSLPLIPGSHKWNEKDIYRTSAKGASINGLGYHVPAIIQTRHNKNEIRMTRPNPKAGEMLIFTPYLIHGAAVNFNPGTTRFAFELRLLDEECRLS